MGEGSQLQQPLAIAVIGGFVLSGPIVLMILPALYAWIDPRGRLAGAPARLYAAPEVNSDAAVMRGAPAPRTPGPETR
jgi:hypothetical protein